jgi:hypothetical protein
MALELAAVEDELEATGSQVPVSHSMTVPPPYCPFGMVPSKPPYSIGWSSTWTARRLSATT